MNTAQQHSISATDGTRDESGKVGQSSTTTISAVTEVREEPCYEASGSMQQGKVRATVARSTTSSSSKAETMRKLNLYKQKEIDLRRQLIELELESVKLQQSRIEQDMEEEIDEEEEVHSITDAAYTSTLIDYAVPRMDQREQPKDVDLAKLSSTRYATMLGNEDTSADRRSKNDHNAATSDAPVPEKPAEQQDAVQVRKVTKPNAEQWAARHAVSALPPFAGEPEKWVRFISSYKSSTALCGFSEEENIERLHTSLKGPALNLVEGLLMLPGTLEEALETLKKRFGRPAVMVEALLYKIRKTPAVKTDKPETYLEFGAANVAPCNHSAHIEKKEECLFRIMPVTLYRGNNQIDTYAFVDEGSSLTMIEMSLAKELGVLGEKDPLQLVWTGLISRIEEDSERVNLKISGKNQSKIFSLANVRTVSNLNLPSQSLSTKNIYRFPHLKGLPIQCYTNQTPKLLIGIDHLKLIAPLKVREGAKQEPIAAKTRLGTNGKIV
uniref:Peptidase A2 domain-containing protein n=1 Tax=Anopheles arabiensis TaxID=7173 RepID=A0A182HFM3_ANOAR